MITNVNSYKLDTRIKEYADGLLMKFGESSYQWASDFGMQRIFKNEKYYWALENEFLERECKEAIVAAVNDLIYKISYRFHDSKEEACIDFRVQVFNYLTSQMGSDYETQEIDSTKLFIWSGDKGNLILELDGYDTGIILTSSAIRNIDKRI
jgi:hypothetical protein